MRRHRHGNWRPGQQCADAVIRLRAEYLWQAQKYDSIQFHLTNGFLMDYNRWARGDRVRVSPDQRRTAWYHASDSVDYSHSTFRKYLDFVFTYAGTASLAKYDLKPRQNYPNEMEIGDVFITPGSPGHAVIVVDLLELEDSYGGKRFMLAQSYMPAQEIEILKNKDGSPWFQPSECAGYLENT